MPDEVEVETNENLDEHADAFARVQPEAEALTAEAVLVPRADVLASGQGALRAWEWLDANGRLPRVLELASIGQLDGALVKSVPDLGRAAIHVGRRAKRAQAGDSKAKVSVETWEPANALRKQMLKVLTYHFEDEDDTSATLDYIRSGTGYMDCANDLTALADLYKERVDEVSADPKYSADDPPAARRLSSAILTELRDTSTKEAAEWTDKAARVYTLLDRAYGELRDAALFTFRRDPEAASAFPRLVTAGRRARRRSRKPIAGKPVTE